VRTLVLALAALLLAAPAFAHEGRDRAAEDAARGLQYDGLVPARDDGPCRGVGYEFRAGGTVGCTHGPDPAPAGVDVRESPSLEELRATSDAGAPVPCIGDGVSGPRVQALYAYGPGGNRYSSVEPLIQGWAPEVGDIVRSSAFGAREVRFVTDSACRVDVRPVAVSASALGSFDTMIDELASKGYGRTDRKYLVWVEATTYCGIAGMYPDLRLGEENRNNGGFPALVARVDSGCWNGTAPTHELVHTLGGVQRGAPNASNLGHCTDEHDVMCYDDDRDPSTYPLRLVCDASFARRLDCNGDDYFNVSPVAGSWLAAHWNTANSSFLEGSMPRPRPDAPTGLRLAVATVSGLVVEWSSVAGASGYRLYLDGAPIWSGTGTRAELNGLPCGREFTVGVEALDSGETASARTAITAATRACPDRQPPVVTVRAASGGRGTLVRLRYTAVDAGKTREWIAVFRGRTRLKAFATGFANRSGGASVRWRIPRTAGGPLRFCVMAGDAAGNASALRCAPIRLT
jgi:hypothetical protein